MCIAHKHKSCGQINYHAPISDLLAFRRVGPFPAAKCDKHSCCLIKTLNPKFTHIEAIWSNTHLYVKMIPNWLWKFNQNHFQLVILWFTTYHLEVFQLEIGPQSSSCHSLCMRDIIFHILNSHDGWLCPVTSLSTHWSQWVVLALTRLDYPW